MPATSAGLLVYRHGATGLEVFLVHPGGPFWANKDEHAWSVPKGEFDPDDEHPRDAARREFVEETGLDVPEGPLLALGTIRQSGGKVVHAFAALGDLDREALDSNTFEMEWPPRSGRTQVFPEVDRGAWFTVEDARARMHRGQAELLDRLETALTSAD